MKDCGIIHGSEEQAKEVVVGSDTVYVHTDIEQIEGEHGEILFQYHEVQYDKDEYIKLIGTQNKELGELVNTILGVTSNE